MRPSWRLGLWMALAIVAMGTLAALPAAADPQSHNMVFTQPHAMQGADSCADLAWRRNNNAATPNWKQRWYNYAGPNSTNVPILSFNITSYNPGTRDTVVSFYVHSLCERTNTISRIYLYRDVDGTTDTNSFFNGADQLLATVPVGIPFQTNDSVLVVVNYKLAADLTRFHLVVDMNSAGIDANPVYDGTGVTVEIRNGRGLMGRDDGGGRTPIPTGGDVTNPCVPTSPANNGYSIIIDNRAPECVATWPRIWDFREIACTNDLNAANDACDDAIGTTISLGDSLLFRHLINVVNPATDTCVTGWPKLYVREFGNFPNPVSMDRQSTSDFTYVNDFADFLNIPTSSITNPIDVLGGFYYLVVQTKDVQGNVASCSTAVAYPIDTKKPVVAGRPKSWTLIYDANNNGIVNPQDSIRLFVDMSNEPFGEICMAWTTIYGWTAVPFSVVLTDVSGDRKFEKRIKVSDMGPGILDALAGTQTVQLHVVDNACNEDSLPATLSNAVDNQGLTMASWVKEFLRLLDTDANGCLKIGEQVRIRVTNAGVDTDLVNIWANLLMAGLGDLNGVVYPQRPLINQGSGTWQLDWILGDEPQDSAIDYAAGNPAAVVWLYAEDDAGNRDSMPTSYLEAGSGGYDIDTKYPLPVTGLRCESVANGIINLYWDNEAPGDGDADRIQIYYTAAPGPINFGGSPVAEINNGIYSWTTDGTITLTDGVVYLFSVVTIDDCGNIERVHPLPVACLADATPPNICVFQPLEDTTKVYTCDHCDFVPGSDPTGLTFYIHPDSAIDRDVAFYIDTILVRLKNQGDGSPGPWTPATPPYGFQIAWLPDPELWEIQLSCAFLDGFVGPNDIDTLELILLGHDWAGNVQDRAAAILACGTWEFIWSNVDISGQIVSVNGDLPMYVQECNLTGFELQGPDNTVSICVSGGTPPYKIRAQVSDQCEEQRGDGAESSPVWNQVYYIEGVMDTCTTFNLDLTNFENFPSFPAHDWSLRVEWCDVSGAYDSDVECFCIPDSIPPCAVISNPVDGKCIRRSRSMLDPEEICVAINPIANCIDPDQVVKVDFQWSQDCCLGTAIDTFCYEVRCSVGVGFTSDSSCTTFAASGITRCHYTPGTAKACTVFVDVEGLDSTICYTSTVDTLCTITVCDLIEVPCEDVFEWHTFALTNGGIPGTPSEICTQWWNTDDLSWITESGTIIYLRAILYDQNGNKFTTECRRVCVDLEPPPLCLATPDACNGKLAGDSAVFYATLDWSKGNVDDIENVYLYFKKTTAPDVYGSWSELASGKLTDGGTNETVWRWDVNLTALADYTSYDFRVIAKSIWGTWSWDQDGDSLFDAGTFSADSCDMDTWLIDRSAPEIAFDTVWTTVGDQPVVQPNVSCALSDPRGWVWAQYGKEICFQTKIWDNDPYAIHDDLEKVVYTLYDGESVGECRAATCACQEASPDTSGFTTNQCTARHVVRIKTGADALDTVCFDPSKLGLSWVNVSDGFKTLVLKVDAYDSCGNVSTDCITLYLLDTDPTEAIIVSPMNDQVFCSEVLSGPIQISAMSLLGENWNKAVFEYSGSPNGPWLPIDSVGASSSADGVGTMSVYWYPSALDVPDGTYYLRVWAVDHALNRMVSSHIVTVHISCAAPTVALTHPTTGDPEFMGCEIELSAAASSPDAVNPIDSVVFYYQSITSSTVNRIGIDPYSVNGNYYYHWDPPVLDGPYYIFARAWNRAKKMAESDKVEVKFDGTAPWARIIEVNGDGSEGSSSDPTLITIGTDVPIAALATDRNSPSGYGKADNCGVDSVVIYAKDREEKVVVFGVLMTVDPTVDSMFNGTWNTSGLPTGEYKVWIKAWDCACNGYTSPYWYVELFNPSDLGTIAADPTVTICDMASTNADSIAITFTRGANVDVEYVYLYHLPPGRSDVVNQWIEMGDLDSVSGNTWWSPNMFDISDWEEGTHGLRAVIEDRHGNVSEDFDGSGWFDDFTFDPATRSWHMWLRVDRSATTFTQSHVATLKAHDDLAVTITPDLACDIDHVCYGVESEADVVGVDSCLSSLSYSFDPVDSGLVSLDEVGVWHGAVHTTVYDALGNSTPEHLESYRHSDLWIIEVATANHVAIVDPRWNDYVTGSSTTVTARKISSSSVSSVQFFYGAATGAGTSIDTDNSASGDEFSVSWSLSGVSAGEKYIWATTSAGESRRVRVIVAPAPANVKLDTSKTDYAYRQVGNQTVVYVGGRVDLCVDTASISTLHTVGIDSIVFCYRMGDAPGNSIPENPDPTQGWVRIGVDRYGSLCVDWFTDEVQSGVEGCLDGRRAVVAWVYDRAGNVVHSEVVHFVVDNTPPYSEIVDIDGDETFGDCHTVEVGADKDVKFKAVAIDDRSCAGKDPQDNSGARYLQFFVGGCGGAGAGVMDIVWVIDGSNSMCDDYDDGVTPIASNAARFFDGLVGVDYRVGVLGFSANSYPIDGDGSLGNPEPGGGQFTTAPGTFGSMVRFIGDCGAASSCYYYYECEYGLTAIDNALKWYPFRPNAQKVIILVTDEPGDEYANPAIIERIVKSGAKVITVTDPLGIPPYALQLGTLTGGENYDLRQYGTGWGGRLAAIASFLTFANAPGSTGAGASDVGVVWGKQVTLADGQDNAFANWDPSGLPPGEYCAWTTVIDQVGNWYRSDQVKLCLIDKTPPVGYIAGFATTTDEHMRHTYRIFGQSWDQDIDHVQFQYRSSTSSSQTDWTGIGVAQVVNGDPECWTTVWNPCLLSGAFDLRMVPTDRSGNEDFDIQPILKVNLVKGSPGCEDDRIVLVDTSRASTGFLDNSCENLGLVSVSTTETDKFHSMTAVYTDMSGGWEVEKVDLWEVQGQDPGSAYMGSFHDDIILDGGMGLFWVAYNDEAAKKTYLSMADLTVYHVEPELGLPGTVASEQMGAKVELQPGALDSENGLVLFPAIMPTLWLEQQHLVAWPNKAGMATAIRFTDPEYYFNTGKYAKVEISYSQAAVTAMGLSNTDLTVAWWDGDEWNMTDDIISAGPIANGKAAFHTNRLHCIYAIVSAGGTLNPGAVDVRWTGAWPYCNGYTGYTSRWPELKAIVRSKINYEQGNPDIDDIIVTIDGNVVNSEDQGSAEDWDVDWDNVSGELSVGWQDSEMPLSGGRHTISIKANNEQGYWNMVDTAFYVDASEPDVNVVTGYVCPNPTFTFSVTDQGSGVNWDSVYIDVYDISESSPGQNVPKDKLIHTESPDAWTRVDDSTVTFTLTLEQAVMRRMRIVIYNGERYLRDVFFEDCSCWKATYDYDGSGVPDCVGNGTEIVDEEFTVSTTACGPGEGGGGGDIIVTAVNGAKNPFDPWRDEFIAFSLNGFAAGGGVVTAGVYDLAGYKVASLKANTTQGLVEWDGRADNTNRDIVAQGVYLVYFQRSGGAASGSNSQVVKAVVKRR